MNHWKSIVLLLLVFLAGLAAPVAERR